MLASLNASTLDTAVALAALPEQIRGFGPVKLRTVEAARQRREALLSELKGTAQPADRAA